MRSPPLRVAEVVLCVICISLLWNMLEPFLTINQAAVEIAKGMTNTHRSESVFLASQSAKLSSVESAEQIALARLMALHLLYKDQHSEGISLLEKASPQDPVSLFRLGEAYSRLGLHDKAISAWRQARAELYFLERGHQSYETLDYELACTNYLLAVEIAPDMALAHMYAGHCFLRRDQLDRAEQEYRRAIVLDPAYGYPYIHLAHILNTSLQRSEEAMNVLDACLEHASAHWQGECSEAKQIEFEQVPLLTH